MSRNTGAFAGEGAECPEAGSVWSNKSHVAPSSPCKIKPELFRSVERIFASELMKTYAGLVVVGGLIAAPFSTRADYPVIFVPGFTAFANHLDHPGGNRAGLLFPNAPSGTKIYKWDSTNQAYRDVYAYDLHHSGIWAPSEPVINPGEGAFLQSPIAFTNTFTGTAHTPLLPPNMPPDGFYFLSDQAQEVGSYESSVGASPGEGAKVYVFDAAQQPDISQFATWQVYTFAQGAWQPGAPSIPIGVSAFLSVPPV